VALVLANAMAVRNTLETPVLSALAQLEDLEVCFITPNEEDAAKAIDAAPGRFSWADLGNPAGRALPLGHGPKKIVLRRLAERVFMRLARSWADHGNLVYRFNERHKFKGHLFKKGMPPASRQREAVAGNYVDPSLGHPFPNSQALFNLIYQAYYNSWYSEPGIEAFFDEFQPDLVVIHHLQNSTIRPWVASARRRRLPILGIVGSWDQPTTKGPLPPGLDRVLVQSRAMRDQLIKYHVVGHGLIEVTGWPQMDLYLHPETILPKEALAKELGISPERRIILYGTYSERLGAHEPGIAAHLARQLESGSYGDNVSLVLRPHPKDYGWRQRFGQLHDPPRVVSLPNESGRLGFLANLLAYASVVLASTGTVLLDAVALDSCAVNIAFDGDSRVDYQNSIKRWNELDHFAPVVASGGLNMVSDFTQLDQAIIDYLADPAKDAEGRARCRAEQLEPFDGKASHRVADFIAKVALGTI